MDRDQQHTLEFLLAFDGYVHWLEQGYRIKFAIGRVAPSRQRPHGLRYSFTLHDPQGKRLLGFDNAHVLRGSRYKRHAVTMDHWHRTETDEGQPYRFSDADALLADFFREVRRVLGERGVSDTVVRVEDRKYHDQDSEPEEH
jgi:uncharacterized protein DUF6516